MFVYPFSLFTGALQQAHHPLTYKQQWKFLTQSAFQSRKQERDGQRVESRRAKEEFYPVPHFGHDLEGAHLHHIAIRPDPHCKLRSLHEPMDRNRPGQCTALSNKTECERYWEDRTKMMENWLRHFFITIFCDCHLALGLYIYPTGTGYTQPREVNWGATWIK